MTHFKVTLCANKLAILHTDKSLVSCGAQGHQKLGCSFCSLKVVGIGETPSNIVFYCRKYKAIKATAKTWCTVSCLCEHKTTSD